MTINLTITTSILVSTADLDPSMPGPVPESVIATFGITEKGTFFIYYDLAGTQWKISVPVPEMIDIMNCLKTNLLA